MSCISPIFFVLFSTFFATFACAQSIEIVVHNAWIREAPPGSKVLAAYMEISNASDQTVTLTGISSPAFEKIELHQTEQIQGVARMRHQKSLVVPPKGILKLAPEGFHAMLFQPRNLLKAGDWVPIQLYFINGTMSLEAEVRKATGFVDHDHH